MWVRPEAHRPCGAAMTPDGQLPPTSLSHPAQRRRREQYVPDRGAVAQLAGRCLLRGYVACGQAAELDVVQGYVGHLVVGGADRAGGVQGDQPLAAARALDLQAQAAAGAAGGHQVAGVRGAARPARRRAASVSGSIRAARSIMPWRWRGAGGA